jgi:hypothetical protein
VLTPDSLSDVNGLASALELPRPITGDDSTRGDARARELVPQIVDGTLSVQAACERHRVRREDVQEGLGAFYRTARIAFDEQLRTSLIRQGATADVLGGGEFRLSLSDISIIDWIQAIQMFAKQAVITVLHDQSESRLWCSNGAVIDAESGRLSGEAAVHRIVSLEQGHVITELRPVRRERTIHSSTQLVLLEAARRKDEASLLRRRLGDLARRYRAAGVASSRSLNTAETVILRSFTGTRRLSRILELSELGDVETLAALESLMRTGFLVEATAGSDVEEGERAERAEEKEKKTSSPPAASSERVPSSVLPVSIAWPSEKKPWKSNARWFASTAMMAGVVALAAWYGANAALASAAAMLSSTIPSVAPGPERAASHASLEAAPPERPPTYDVSLRAQPPHAMLELDGTDIGAGNWTARFPRDGAPHELRITAAGFVPARILFIDSPPPSEVQLEPMPAPALPVAPEVEAAASLAKDTASATAKAVPPTPRRRVPRRGATASPRRAEPKLVRPEPSIASSPPQKKKPQVQIIDGEALAADRR